MLPHLTHTHTHTHQDRRILTTLSHHIYEEEHLAAVRAEAERERAREAVEEERRKKERYIRHQRELVLSRERFRKEVCPALLHV